MPSPFVRGLLDELAEDPAARTRLAEIIAPVLRSELGGIDSDDDRWLTAREAAAYVGLSVQALYRHTSARTIPFEQTETGGKMWFKRADLDRWRRGEWQRPGLRPVA
jgi:excisionase family DNA binding protein